MLCHTLLMIRHDGVDVTNHRQGNKKAPPANMADGALCSAPEEETIST